MNSCKYGVNQKIWSENEAASATEQYTRLIVIRGLDIRGLGVQGLDVQKPEPRSSENHERPKTKQG